MRAESKSRLYAILNRHGSRAAAAAVPTQQASAAEVPFAVAYARTREEVILPTLREFAAVLESSGRPCELIEEEHPYRHADLATIGLRLFPAAARIVPVGEYPSLTFFPEPLTGTVRITASNLLAGGQNVRRADHALDQITAAVVEEEVLGLLDEVFRA